ncbi:plasma-membrane choline transporter-domain-containing protein [Coemansia spiralis]|nr:plasma-membrane choline transporter-domain-containing protein [Coemansia spiralis]
MSFRDTEFQNACLAWISKLSGENVAGTADLVDASILIQLTTQSDPDYFASASLVLPSYPGEPNLDALAQLARLLLRYFEQGLGRLLAREYIPGVNSLTIMPFDDLWRLTILVVSATLLSEINGASELYEQLDKETQMQLQVGIGGMWGTNEITSATTDFEPAASNAKTTFATENETVNTTSSSKSNTHGIRASSHIIERSEGSSQEMKHQQPSPLHTSSNGASNDSFVSDQTSLFQPFQSAYSSIPDLHQPNQRQLEDIVTHTSSASSSWEQNRHMSNSLEQLQQPALLPVSDIDHSIVTDSSSDRRRQRRRSLIGFVHSDSENEDNEDNADNTNEPDNDSDTESYVSEFSQDLDEYGQDIVSVGFNGPNAFAAYVFIGNALAYIAVGCYLLLTTSVPSRKSPYFKDYYDMTVAITQILLTSIASVALSITWVQLMRYQTRKVVWITTLGVPVVSIATAIWAGIQVFRIPGVEDIVGYRLRNGIVIGISLILAIRFIWSISQRKTDIERSVDIIRVSCDVLMHNKELFAFSLLLLAFYGVFAVISTIFASRITLIHSSIIGSANRLPASGSTGYFDSFLATAAQLVSGHAWGVAGYLLVIFAWTSAVFVQLMRIIVSSVVCQWYFHRHEPNEPPALQTLQASTVSALTHQFGTVVLSATFLFVAKTLHLIELLLRWIVSFLRVIPVSIVSLAMGQPIYLAEGWSSYTAVYAAFTGKGFFESSAAVTGLLRKHHLLHSPVVSLIKSSVTCYALLLSIVFGYALGVQAVDMLSLHSAAIAIAGSAMPFILLQLVTHVLTCTVEALVVCYAIDLEVDSCHSINVAEALALA